MKLIPVLSLILYSVSASLYSQDTIRVYYDKSWKEINDKTEAEYYRKAFRNSDNSWSVCDYYKSNNIQMTGTYTSKDFKTKNGKFIYYFESGQVKTEITYQNNKIEGTLTNWFENGNKENEGNFKDDISKGAWFTWYENGGRKSEGAFLQGKAQGLWEYWYETGEKKAEGKFLVDKRDGIWKYWYTNGQLSAEEVYNNGLISSYKTYYENGVMKYKGNFVKGKAQGEWTYWNADGRVYLKGNYIKGERNGEWLRSFREGNMKIIYKNGIYQGPKTGGGIVRNE